jgi:hypothetical protein
MNLRTFEPSNLEPAPELRATMMRCNRQYESSAMPGVILLPSVPVGYNLATGTQPTPRWPEAPSQSVTAEKNLGK